MNTKVTKHMTEPNEENTYFYKVLNYYKEQSYKLGYNEKERKHENYSLYYFLSWFNQNNLNKLTKRFLGSTKKESFDSNTDDIPNEEGKHHSNTNDINNFLLESKYDLNASQIEAIKNALNSEISFIQGPPGTGKTETILNLVSCIINKKQNVAVVSNNKHALNNISQKIDEYRKEIKRNEMNFNEKNFPNKNNICKSYAELGNKKTRLKWSSPDDEKKDKNWKFKNSSNKDITLSSKLDNNRYSEKQKCILLNNNENKIILKGWTKIEESAESEDSKETKVITRSKFLNKYPFITTTIHSLIKCFSDIQISGNIPQYDFVIIDEASQCNIITGLVAMACAKHLVIVGDKEQLAPIYNINNDKLQFSLDHIPLKEKYLMNEKNSQDGQSIMASAEQVFIKAPNTILNSHYRCHPGIIKFCNEEIYDNKLKIKTDIINFYTKKIETPIKILWYEGNYCEKCWVEDKTKNKDSQDKWFRSKRNMKQITIFKKEELDYIEAQLKKYENFSVAILSPFRGQYREIEKMLEYASKEKVDNSSEWKYPKLKDALKKNKIETTNYDGDNLNTCNSCENDSEINDEDEEFIDNHIEYLTIHKSQGQEFDLVYLLPAEDGDWEWPWSQGKRLINVAVSRAKQELRVICSTCLMKEETQRKLTENYILPSKAEIRDGEEPEEFDERKKQLEQQKDNQLYIQKLTNYVYKRTKEIDNDWGFHKSDIQSVFDELPAFRQKNGNNKNLDITEYGKTYFFTEKLIEEKFNEFCLEVDARLEVFSHVPLDAIENIGEKLTETTTANDNIAKDEKFDYINNCAHFDIVVTLNDDNTENKKIIVMVAEIDGEYHRFNKYSHINTYYEYCENRKDAIARDLQKYNPDNKKPCIDNIIYKRYSVDGKSFNEIKSLKKDINRQIKNIKKDQLCPIYLNTEFLENNNGKNNKDDANNIKILKGFYPMTSYLKDKLDNINGIIGSIYDENLEGEDYKEPKPVKSEEDEEDIVNRINNLLKKRDILKYKDGWKLKNKNLENLGFLEVKYEDRPLMYYAPEAIHYLHKQIKDLDKLLIDPYTKQDNSAN